jgi:MYXO-CTERM domain-containing protein
MKKILIVAAMAALMAVNAFGQGSVVFSNAGGQPLSLSDGTARIPIGSTYQVELMYAPDGTSAADFDTMAVRQGNVASFNPTPGFFSGGGRTVDTIQPPGGFGLFQVRAWSTANGTSYNDVVGKGTGLAGQSQILRVDTANPVIGEANVGLVASGLTGFSVTPVPEPSAIALGVLGLGTLLLLRRRK